MSDRPDDRPLSSEELIKQARSDLDRRPGIEEMQTIDTDQIREEIDQEMPSPSELVAPPPQSRRRPETPQRVRRVRRGDNSTPAGFGDAQQRSSNAVAIAVALALLIAGAAAFIAVAASGAG